ncbi:hypothetical protein QQF64_025816 [Cirrhinus molitorella]|uniref:Uncharacterized protein n=1 Tax=Cirrhinus molitorella TaxID=172907 RepID=A0ABR3NR54_9TELE
MSGEKRGLIVIIVEFAVFAAPTVILLQIICARRAEGAHAGGESLGSSNKMTMIMRRDGYRKQAQSHIIQSICKWMAVRIQDQEIIHHEDQRILGLPDHSVVLDVKTCWNCISHG